MVALLLVGSLATTGCSFLPGKSTPGDTVGSSARGTASQAPTGGQPAPTISAGATQPPAVTAQATEPPSAADALAAKVNASLTKLGSTTSGPNRDQMRAAMVEAGAASDKLEISIDKTPTGLAVDAIEAAAPIGKQCVIGQVRDGKASVAVLPILATGLCFVGDQH
nr:hypothetical protein [Arthrobacter silviterrae]